MKRLRVLLGLTEVSGYYEGLKRGLDELGVSSVHLSLKPHRFGYRTDTSHGIVPSMVRFTVVRRIEAIESGRRVLAAAWLVPVVLTRIALLVWAIAKFDAIVMGGGASFFRYWELPLLRLLGKRVVYFFHGTDARPPYIDGFFRAPHRTAAREELRPLDDANAQERIIESRRRFENVRFVERHADYVICAPSYSHFLSRPFICSLYIGIPRVLALHVPDRTDRCDRTVRILHAPSERAGKGTALIRATIRRLQAKGHAIDYVEISGVSNVRVLEELARCDFVVDQAYCDGPMASLATEAAHFGKPTVVAGYYAAVIRDDIPEHVIPPTLFCLPEELELAIEKLVSDDAYRRELGRRALRFVTENWAPAAVAARMLRILNGDPDPAWFYDPRRVKYLHGMGLPESAARAVLRQVIEAGGEAALCLEDKPELKRRFVRFAQRRAEHTP